MKTTKNPKANLENKRGIFFQIGLIITLTVVFFAFESKTYDARHIDFVVGNPFEPPIELPPIFNEVDNKTKTDDKNLFNPEITPNTPVLPYVPPPPPPEPPSKEPDFFTVVEEKPSFPGGDNEMLKFLSNNINYPEMARELGISGKVYIEFIVEKDGSISNINLLRPIGGGCEEEAMRVVNLMPKWNPGKQRNKAVRVKLSLPVNFVLK
ncbi:MAG: energy transducer TonB [Saprospiraceae bacterium]|nr:energy transducer TonB [Saprospiraceae bacterium]